MKDKPKSITTNRVEPMRPAFPAKKKPAKGPMLTTSNTDPGPIKMAKRMARRLNKREAAKETR